MGITSLRYGALLSYSPHGISKDEVLSRSYRTAIKNDEPIKSAGIDIPMSRYIAEYIQREIGTLPFRSLFNGDPTLVPIRSSTMLQPNSLDMPLRMATELHRVGLGKAVGMALRRVQALPKSATSRSGQRSTAAQHFASQRVQKLIEEPTSILLVDDVITTGATMIGSANLLAQTYPNASIGAFAGLRTVSDPDEFNEIFDSVSGTVKLYPSGRTHRDP